MSKKNSLKNWLLLIALTLIWGTSYILIKKSLLVFSPLQTAALRVSISMFCCLPFLPQAFRNIPRQKYLEILVVGLLGSGIPAFLFAFAMTHISSSVNGIINSLSPLFTVLTGFLFWKIAAPYSKFIGVLIGLAGAIVLILAKTGLHFEGELLFALLPVVATFCYGTNSNFVKQNFPSTNALHVTALAMLFIGIPSLLVLLISDIQATFVSPHFLQAFLCLVALALFGTVIGWLLFYKLVQNTDALFASSVTYLIPLVAIAWGIADGEQLLPLHFAGMLLILVGVYFVSKK